MCPIVAGAGVQLDYEIEGYGPSLLLIHDLAADRTAWAGTSRELAATARVIAYSRRGYGDSEAPEPYVGTTVQEQAQDAASLLGKLAPGGALVAGQGFGALIALDLLLHHAELVQGILADPLLFAFVPAATRELSDERVLIEDAVRSGGLAAGVEAWLGDRAGGERLERARASAGAFFADYAGIASWPVTRGELRSLAVPAVVLTGPATRAHVVQAADALAALMPQATRAADGDLAGSVRSLISAS